MSIERTQSYAILSSRNSIQCSVCNESLGATANNAALPRWLTPTIETINIHNTATFYSFKVKMPILRKV